MVSGQHVMTDGILSIVCALFKFNDLSTTGLMLSGPAALVGSSPASSFKLAASDISIWGISRTLGLNIHCFSLFSVIILNYSIQLIWNYINDKKIILLTFYIELSSKSVGVGLHFARLKYN